MANEQKPNPTTAEESDISKAQSAQQPQADADRPDEGLTKGETLAEQRTDVEGASRQPNEKAEEESGFIGTEGETDTSSKLVEDEEFTPEGK